MQTDNFSTARPQDAVLSDMILPYRRTFFPLGFSVEISSNEPEVLEAAEESFGHVQSRIRNTSLEIRIGVSSHEELKLPPEPTRREYNHLYSLVADVNNQALLDLKTGTNFAWLTRTVVKNRLYFRHNFIEKIVYLLLGASYVTDLHAACVSKNGKGVLLLGNSGAGKSTLAYGCARSGWTYTSDDTSYLINNSDAPRVIGHCHRARFRPSARELFSELEGRMLTQRLEGKPSIEVPITELPVAHTASVANVDAIVVLNRQPSGEAQLISLPRGTASQLMSRELYSAGEIRAKHERILNELWEVPTFELVYCDLQAGIGALETLTL
jgi:hypothetical protein